MKKSIYILIIFLIIFACNSYASAVEYKEKKILIITSFSPLSSSSTLDRISTIKKYYAVKNDVEIYINNLDSNINNTDEFYNNIKSFFKYKYKNINFDVIICLDEISSNFAKTNYNELFKNKPIIFSSMNNNIDTNSNNNFFTIKQNINIEKNLELAFSTHPSYKKVYIPLNKDYIPSLSYFDLIKSIEKLKLKYKDIQFYVNENASFEDIKNFVKNNYNNSIILITTPVISNDVELMTQNELIKNIYSYNHIPIYTLYENLISYGAIGGYVSNTFEEGKLCADISYKLLNNQKINKKIYNPKQYFALDYNKLLEFKKQVNSISPNIKLINKPPNKYIFSKTTIYFYAICIIFILILIIIVLIIYIKKNKYLENIYKKPTIQYKNLIKIFPKPAFILDDYKVFAMSDLCLDLFNIKNYKDIFNSNIKTILSSHNNNIIIKNISSHEQGIKVMKNENFIINYNNSKKTMKIISYPWKFKNKEYILFLLEDITDEKEKEISLKQFEMENLKLKNKEMSNRISEDFFQNIEHEFKTPLNTLSNFIQYVEKKSMKNNYDSSISSKFLNPLKVCSYRLTRIINNLIILSNINNNSYKENHQNYDIIFILKNITKTSAKYLSQRSSNKKILIKFYSKIEHQIVLCDIKCIEKIILNLISNAIKFSSNFKSFISIKIKVIKKDDYIYIYIKDNGIGIPKDNIESIFNNFRQVDKSPCRNHEGSGIGLPVVKHLLDIHGSEINVRSKNNKGSTFIIKLPIRNIDINNTSNDEIISYKHISKYNYNKHILEQIEIEFSDIYFHQILTSKTNKKIKKSP